MGVTLRRVILVIVMIAIAAVMFLNVKAKRDRAAAARGKPNIIVLLVDAMRPDHLGVYGYDRPTSPNLDALAAESIVFDNAFAHAHSTFLSVPSIFTSLFPLEAQTDEGGFYRLKKGSVTLAEKLKRAGYSTAAFSANPLVHPDYGLGRGFDAFFCKWDVPATELSGRALKWLKRGSRQPFFIYFHYMEPHSNYEPPEEFHKQFVPADYQPSRRIILQAPGNQLEKLIRKGVEFTEGDKNYVRSLYDAEIAAVDSSIGEFIESLKEKGLYDNSIIVVVADHGEEFWEHNRLGHSDSMYDEVLRVPLFIKLPASTPAREERISTAAMLSDLYPTLLELVEVPHTAAIRGKNLFSLSPDENRSIYAEATDMRALRKEGWKLIDKPGARADELYHVAKDSLERENVIQEHPEIADTLRAEMNQLAQAAEPAAGAGLERKELDPKTLERLRSLGYID